MSPSQVPEGGQRGYIIPIGGAEEKEHDPRILKRFVALCGGPEADIVVIPTASRLKDTGSRYESIFGELDAGRVTSLDFDTRLGLLLGQAGNREDDAIRDLAATAARFQPDLVVLKDLEGFMRGREPGEVPGLLRRELRAQGLVADHLQMVLLEEEAVLTLLDWARAGDVLVLPMHGLQVRNAVGAKLNRLEAAGRSAGDLQS